MNQRTQVTQFGETTHGTTSDRSKAMNQNTKFQLTMLDGLHEAQHGLPENTQSRRDVMRRLAAVGLFAAGGTALPALDAEGKGKNRGKQQNRGKGKNRGKQQNRGKGKNRGEELGNEDEVPSTTETSGTGEPDTTEGAWTHPDLVLSNPTLTNRILSFESVPFQPANVRVRIKGNITFSTELRRLMAGGRAFAVDTQLWESDRAETAFGASELRFTLNSSNLSLRFAVFTGFGTSATRSFNISQVLSRSSVLLDQESGTDENVGKIRLFTRAPGLTSLSSFVTVSDFAGNSSSVPNPGASPWTNQVNTNF